VVHTNRRLLFYLLVDINPAHVRYSSLAPIAELTGHTDRVLNLAQSPDGATVVSLVNSYQSFLPTLFPPI